MVIFTGPAIIVCQNCPTRFYIERSGEQLHIYYCPTCFTPGEEILNTQPEFIRTYRTKHPTPQTTLAVLIMLIIIFILTFLSVL